MTRRTLRVPVDWIASRFCYFFVVKFVQVLIHERCNCVIPLDYEYINSPYHNDLSKNHCQLNLKFKLKFEIRVAGIAVQRHAKSGMHHAAI